MFTENALKSLSDLDHYYSKFNYDHHTIIFTIIIIIIIIKRTA